MRFLGAFGRFWYDFVIGDDWKIAAAVVAALTLGAIALAAGLPAGAAAPLTGALVAAGFLGALWVDAR
ncbi:MAG: hypothetical protein HYR62_07960 [Actinobacteria bacterium]|nr:hypothetical protein [Actinomycetota bacterium]MBI3687621.1 hypothetical protein [Actinomycetota bacterium]